LKIQDTGVVNENNSSIKPNSMKKSSVQGIVKIAVAVVLSILAAINSINAQIADKSIIAYGAKADTNILNTVFIQKAIDDAAAAGGGRVIIPAGEFRTGTIMLRSGVNLHLEKGAVLAGSDRRKDYDAYQPPALIIAKEQHDISITGNGTVDGRGRQLIKDIFKRIEESSPTDPDWRKKRPAEGTRTNLIYFEGCDRVNVKGVLFKDATSWVTHYERCNHVVIDSIRLESVAYWNNDGIDIMDCKNVRITNSFINAADDAICLKSTKRGEYCDSVYIDNCTLRSSANAFKLGTSCVGGFKNITVKNLTVYDTYRSAIALEAVDGGFLENIDIRNVVATNTGNAIFIKLGHRNKDSVYSVVKNIFIGNVKVEVPEGKPDAGYEMEGPLLMYPPGIKPLPGKLISVSPWNYKETSPDVTLYKHNVFPSSISGLSGHQVENVRLENIEITYKGGASKEVNYFPVDSFNMITEAEKDYPEFSMFGELPVWGFYVRHVNGLSLKNIKLVKEKDDYRTAVLINDVNGIALKNIQVEGAKVLPVILMNDIKRPELKEIGITSEKIEIRNAH
jgi:polygalacturonase